MSFDALGGICLYRRFHFRAYPTNSRFSLCMAKRKEGAFIGLVLVFE